MIRTENKLAQSDVVVKTKDGAKWDIAEFKSYPHWFPIGGTFEATFNLISEADVLEVWLPGMESPMVVKQ